MKWISIRNLTNKIVAPNSADQEYGFFILSYSLNIGERMASSSSTTYTGSVSHARGMPDAPETHNVFVAEGSFKIGCAVTNECGENCKVVACNAIAYSALGTIIAPGPGTLIGMGVGCLAGLVVTAVRSYAKNPPTPPTSQTTTTSTTTTQTTTQPVNNTPKQLT